MHVLLRPPERRTEAGLRDGLPNRIDQVRRDRTTCGRSGSRRMEQLKARGFDDVANLRPVETSVGGIHAFFIVRGDPKTYNLPPNPEVPTVYLRRGWTSAGLPRE